jgi:succinyl-CoA synthetase beta subunit
VGIQEMIEGLRSARLLRGFRGRAAVDVPALARQVARLCDAFLARSDLAEIEINPLAVRGGQAWVLDAVVGRSE